MLVLLRRTSFFWTPSKYYKIELLLNLKMEQVHKEMLNNVDHEKDPNVPPKVR